VLTEEEKRAKILDQREITSIEEGNDRFSTGPLIAEFGTLESPAYVPSANIERIVGCIGGNGVEHDLKWMNIRHGYKHMCTGCGQIFELVKVEVEHDPHHH
jgi:hypothetical protein